MLRTHFLPLGFWEESAPLLYPPGGELTPLHNQGMPEPGSELCPTGPLDRECLSPSHSFSPPSLHHISPLLGPGDTPGRG